MGIIPEDDLQRAFDYTFKTHDSKYAISAYDLKNGYTAMLEAEQVERDRVEREKFQQQLKETGGNHQRFECPHCFGSGFREVPDPQGSSYRGVVRCNMCRYWEYERHRIAAKS